MIGICCPPELDIVYRRINALAKVYCIDLERVDAKSSGEYPHFLVSVTPGDRYPACNHYPENPPEWGVYYLAKALQLLASTDRLSGLGIFVGMQQSAALTDRTKPSPTEPANKKEHFWQAADSDPWATG